MVEMEERLIAMQEFETKAAHWDHCISMLTVEGLIMEFGVFSGTSINHIAERVAPHKVYGFDSFKGLPTRWNTVRKGYFALPEPPKVRDNVELVVGLFEDKLPEFLSKHSELASLIHVDCDLYSSTKTVLDHLTPRIVPGTIIMFDELLNYGGWKLHEFKAFSEFMDASSLKYEYISSVLGDHPRPVSVRILSA
jgi:predicted O-methyltransferase YrrM